MAGGIFDIAVSGLLSHQRAIQTTGHNIANVNTDGYTRQRVEFDTRIPQQQGFGYLGTGVEITTVERIYNQFAVDNVRTQTSLDSDLETFHQFASQIDNLLANPDAGLSPTLQEFFSAVQGVADDPSSIPPRQVLLSQATSLIDRFQYIYDRMDSLYQTANSQIRLTVDEVNSLADSIAQLNKDITLQEGLAGGQPANDLRDQRDELIRELSERVNVNVVPQDDGALNVFIGTGQSLVVGGRALTLGVSGNEFDPTQLEITLTTGTGTGVQITNAITGGTLGGMLRFDEEILQPAINQLGLVAAGLAESFNAQHNLGQDLNGALGGDFFTNTTVDVRQGNNAGAATVTAAMTDVTSLTGSDYILRYNGGTSYTLTRLTDNTTFAVDTAVPATLTVDGFTMAVGGGAAVVGDEFKIRPTRFAARDIDLVTNDPREVAAAAPIIGQADFANTGNATITPGIVDATTQPPVDVNLQQPVTITFTGPATFDVVGVGTGNPVGIAYTSGGVISYNGWEVQISGTPAAGDVFTITPNTGGVSDNRNALLLGELQTNNIMLGGTADLQSTYGNFVAEVGTKTHQADINSQAQSVLLRQAVEQREAVSGVNLDEEAANLLRFQQAYQASAQVISTANSLFQDLIGAIR